MTDDRVLWINKHCIDISVYVTGCWGWRRSRWEAFLKVSLGSPARATPAESAGSWAGAGGRKAGGGSVHDNGRWNGSDLFTQRGNSSNIVSRTTAESNRQLATVDS